MALATSLHAQTGVLREVWLNLEGGAVADLTLSQDYPGNPVLRTVDASFASPVNWAERYGVRMRAYLTPTSSGDYTFWVSGDDNCELWLSSDDTAASRVRIAHVPGWSEVLKWNKFAEQRSAPVSLQAGRRYYIEALAKEGYGGDHLEVGWATSPSATPQVIPGPFLTPFEVPASIPTGVVVEAGRDLTQYAPNFQVELNAQALNVANANTAPAVQWSQVSGPAATLAKPAEAATAVSLSRAGIYIFRATASHSGLTATDDVTITIQPPLAADAGKALAEYWFGVDGNTVASLSRSLDYPNFPHAHRLLGSLTQTQSLGEQYGQRIRGFILAPATGSYRFFMAASKKAEFHLSPEASPAGLQLRAAVTTAVNPGDFANHAAQASVPVTLTAGQKYAFEIRHKEDWGNDHCSIMWQQPGQEYMTEISGEFLAPPDGSQAVVSGTQEFDLAHDFILNAGRDAVLHMPRNSLPLSAYESRRIWGADTPTRAWSQVSGTKGVLFSAADSAQTLATFPKAGTYVLRYSVTTAQNTSTDEITVEVKPPVNAQVGSLTRQVWWDRGFPSLDAFRADPAFPQHPDITDTIPDLRQYNSWADRYATRVTGILNVPAGGTDPVNYTFYVSGDDLAEFSISTDTAPAGLRKVCYTTVTSGREVWTNEASQTSAPIPLKPGGRYFVELLHKETWSGDHFAVAWSREGDRRPKLIEGSHLEPAQKAPAFDPSLTFYARAGKDRSYWWPHDRTRLAGSWVKALASDKTPTALWKQTAGPKSVLAEPASLTSEVIFSAPGTYTYELAVTEGTYTHRDSV
ncbi:MAG TPA: PA14 domain-containing protein, partial [Prosthecobacter sp.]